MRAYDPFSIPGLHRTFAKTNQNETAIIEFANRFGSLTDAPHEDLAFWRAGIDNLRLFCDRSDDAEGLKRADLFNHHVTLRMGLKIAQTAEGLRLVAQPRSLYEALLLMAASEVTRGLRFSYCSNCGEVYPWRGNKAFCSDRCRYAHRDKRLAARPTMPS